MGFGQLVVIVPPDVGVRVAAEVVGGRIELFGSAVEGFRIDHSAAQAGEGGVLVLDLSLGFGELTVVRAST
jgi:predicted membrane protein